MGEFVQNDEEWQEDKEKPETLKGKLLNAFLEYLNWCESVIPEMQRAVGNEVKGRYFRENRVRKTE